MAKIIAKTEKPYNNGRTVIMPAVLAVIPAVKKQNALINVRPLGNTPVARHIDVMLIILRPASFPNCK